MPSMGSSYIDRSAEHRAAEKQKEARRLARWEAEKVASLRAHGWGSEEDR